MPYTTYESVPGHLSRGAQQSCSTQSAHIIPLMWRLGRSTRVTGWPDQPGVISTSFFQIVKPLTGRTPSWPCLLLVKLTKDVGGQESRRGSSRAFHLPAAATCPLLSDSLCLLSGYCWLHKQKRLGHPQSKMARHEGVRPCTGVCKYSCHISVPSHPTRFSIQWAP